MRAKTLAAIEDEVNKYPDSYWNTIKKPVTIYTYKASSDKVRSGGYSDNEKGQIWIRGRDSADLLGLVRKTVHHEITHYNDEKIFGSGEQYGLRVYGGSYGKQYGGKSGADAISSGKLGNDDTRPLGFVRDYGYSGGIFEDQATVAECMFTNHDSCIQSAEKDSILARKIAIAKAGYCQITPRADGGCDMDEAYWKNLQPTDPNYKLLPASKPIAPVGVK